MLQTIKDTVNSRKFQTTAGQIGIAVVTLVVTSVVSNAVSGTLNTGLEKLMDKIHGVIEEVATAVEA